MRSIVLLLALAGVSADVVEPKTGIKFSDKRGGASLSRLGVRYKGPIKVYAVGEYSDGTYALKMSYGVGAAKMTSALADALKPRCSDAAAIEEFEECLAKGRPPLSTIDDAITCHRVIEATEASIADSRHVRVSGSRA